MFSKPNPSASGRRYLRRTLAFRLTAAYSIAGLLLVVMATAGLYMVLRAELDRSTELFLADKLHVVRTMLRERPDDENGLREEIELESAARRYQQFYIRLLDEHGAPILTTPGMTEQLDLAELVDRTGNHPEHSTSMLVEMDNPFVSPPPPHRWAHRPAALTRFRSPSTFLRKKHY
jgi:two-component system, OmpR family, heavy metal sensor histidine kinase CusS